MNIRLHEIEFGSGDPEKSKSFYETVLGLETGNDQPDLKVLKPGIRDLDFNTSTHFPPGAVCISFLTDDLEEVMERLTEEGISYEGPQKSHLGMDSISFRDPDGFLVKVNRPTTASPTWLKV